MQLQGLAEEGPPPGDLGGEVVTEVLELLTLGVDGVHSVVFVLNQLLAFQRQGSGPVHSHLHNVSRYQFSPTWRDKWGAWSCGCLHWKWAMDMEFVDCSG